jgi:hypothetical protein
MNRPGFALLFALLVAAAIELLTLSTLALATHENAIAETHQRTVVARRRTETALLQLARHWPLGGLDTLRVGTSTTLVVGGVSVYVTRTAWGLFDATATSPAGSATLSRRLILRRIDAQRGVAEANDAVVAAGVLDALNSIFTEDPMACAPPVAAPRPARLLTVLAPRYSVGLPLAVVDSTHASPLEGYAFAGVRWEEAASIADVVAQGTMALTPTDTSGQPLMQLIYAPGDLVITGGAGSGILLVDGNLQMTNGAHFYGPVVVRGVATLDDEVRITGSLRIQSRGASHLNRAHLTVSRCAVGAALLNVPAADRLIASNRRFLPAF